MTERTALATQVGGDHYKKMPIQPVVFCEVNELTTCPSNIIKYVCRHGSKEGRRDIEKSVHYAELWLDIRGSFCADHSFGGDITWRAGMGLPYIAPTTFIWANRLPANVADVVRLVCVKTNRERVEKARSVLLAMLDEYYGRLA